MSLRQRLARRWPILVALPLLAVGVWQVGAGVAIHGKAMLAQFLLEHAWSRTLAGEREVRPWPWADTWPVARLQAPAHGIDLIVLDGSTGRTMAFGPGYHHGSAEPGEPGLTLLGGHRDTHFRALERLGTDDTLTLQTADGAVHRYTVVGTTVVDHRRAVLRDGPGPSRLALVTCYPFDAVVPGGPLRYIVEAVAETDTSPALVSG